MSDKSKIEWTDATWNPITGCTPASEGCLNCYAKAMAERFPITHAGNHFRQHDKFSKITFHPDRLDQPLHWRKPRKVFVCSMGDLFHDGVLVDWTMGVWDIMARCPQHTFILLTKRAKNMRAMLSHPTNPCLSCLPNVWLGVTVEKNAHRNRIIDLLNTPAAKRLVSIEPMFEDIDIGMSKAICKCCKRWSSRWVVLQRTVRSDIPFLSQNYPDVKPGTYLATSNQHGALCVNGLGIKPAEFTCLPKLDWVICGAETGAHKRPCKPEWIDSLRQQCAVADIPFFGKKDSQGQPIMPREWPK